MSAVPDVAGEIVGWRAWLVATGYRKIRLRSITQETIWPPDAWLVAHCEGRIDDVPHEEHAACGIFAARDRTHLLEQEYNVPGDHQVVAIGTVALVGKVIRCERGWRAARARPLRLWIPYDRWEFALPLTETYGVRVGLDDTLGLDDRLTTRVV